MQTFIRSSCKLSRIINLIEKRSIHSSIDPKEIEHHSNLAKIWWDLDGPLAALHTLNTIRVPFIRDGLKTTNKNSKDKINSAKPLENVKILEVGCGAGILTEQLARIYGNVVAIDPSQILIETARNHLKKYSPNNGLSARIEYRTETIEEHNLNSSTMYDAVVVSEVIEHIDDKESFLKSCTTPLAPGGSIFITTFNKTMFAWFAGIICAEYILKMIPQGTHDYNKFISPLDTQKLLENCGCSTVLCNGFIFLFWKDRWMWTKHTQFSYALQAVKS